MTNTSRDDFEREYAERSGITVERLRALGRIVRPCHCGDALCEGWQSVNGEAAEEDDRLRPGWDGDERDLRR